MVSAGGEVEPEMDAMAMVETSVGGNNARRTFRAEQGGQSGGQQPGPPNTQIPGSEQ